MAFESFKLPEDETANRVLVTVAAEVLLACAVALGLFVYSQLPIAYSTGIALVLLFVGSVFCWKSYSAAQIVLVLSLLVTEFVVLTYFGWLLLPFIVLDIVVVAALARSIQAKES